MKTPRPGSTYGEHGTWLEPEELCYPNGKMVRRCRARHVTTKELVSVTCGIPDTLFSIPCRGGGWVGYENGEFQYHPPRS